MKPTDPLLTIVTITRNDATGLAATLASTSRLRERADVEHIIVDGNDANTSAVEAPCGVPVLRREPRGVSDAFNVGLAAASGEWVWFLNGGDTVHPEMDVDFVTHTLTLTKADAVIFDVEREDGISYRPTLPEVWPPVFNWIPHQGTIVRTEVIRMAGGFSTAYRITGDMDLWFRLFSRNTVVDLVSHHIAQFAAGGVSATDVALLSRESLRTLWANRRRVTRHFLRQALLVPYAIALLLETGLFRAPPRWIRIRQSIGQ